MALYSIGVSHGKMAHCSLHSHTAWEVVLNTEGEGIAEIGGQGYPFSQSTVMCIPPGLPHGKESGEGFADLYFHTNSALATPSLKAREPIILQDDRDKSLEALLQLMVRLHHQDAAANRGIVGALHAATMQLLNSWLAKKRLDPIVEQLQNRLVDSFTDPELSLKKLLDESGYTPDYARRLFRRETGMTPGEYLARLRIDYAKQLMRQQKHLGLSVANISLMCGYYDPRYFSRTFRRSTGFSPREYINRQAYDGPDGPGGEEG